VRSHKEALSHLSDKGRALRKSTLGGATCTTRTDLDAGVLASAARTSAADYPTSCCVNSAFQNSADSQHERRARLIAQLHVQALEGLS
jgi:hypothetical protein